MIQFWVLAGVLGFGVLLIICVVIMITFILCTYTSYNDSFENDSFEGIKNNPRLLTAIQLSMINQKETLERTMETGEDTRLYQCTSCKVSAEEEDGEHPCSHCGRIMETKELLDELSEAAFSTDY